MSNDIPDTFYQGWVAGIPLLECKICHAAVPIHPNSFLEESPLIKHERYHKQLAGTPVESEGEQPDE